MGRHQAGLEGPSTSDHRRKWQKNGDQKQVRGRVRQSLPGSRGCHAADDQRILARGQ